MRKRRGVSLAIVAMVAWAAVGCSRPDGEAWAKSELGDDLAEKLRAEAAEKLGHGGGPETFANPGMAAARGAPKAPYLPRPYLVFDLVVDDRRPDRSKLAYAKMNKDRGFDYAAGVKAFVVVKYDTVIDGYYYKRGRKIAKSHTGVLLELFDRSTGSITYDGADRPDDIRAELDELPQSPP
jgi:hypothetical protein